MSAGGFVEFTCPFCSERDFDAFGLKLHFIRGWCEPFEALSEHNSELSDANRTISATGNQTSDEGGRP